MKAIGKSWKGQDLGLARDTQGQPFTTRATYEVILSSDIELYTASSDSGLSSGLTMYTLRPEIYRLGTLTSPYQTSKPVSRCCCTSEGVAKPTYTQNFSRSFAHFAYTIFGRQLVRDICPFSGFA